MSSLLWIIYKPSPWQIPVQAVLLLACFTVRYNAIYYPVIAALAFLLSRQGWKTKAGGITLGCALIFGSVLYTSQKMQTITGQRQFSAFGGWQLANNALYMYEHIPAKERGPVPAKFAALETMVREHMDTLRKVKLSAEDSASNFFYLWSGRGPLIQYLERSWKKDSTTPYFKRWASEGPLYADYALYLIRKYPIQFAVTFLVPNAVKFAVPPAEFLGVYNMGSDSVSRLAKEWFNYKSQKIKNQNKKDKKIWVTNWYPTFAAIVNVLMLISIVGMFVFNGFTKENGRLIKLTLLAFSIWIINIAFSVFASPIVLRYQAFPLLISLCLATILTERIYILGTEEEHRQKTTLL